MTVEIKVCGVTRLADIELCVELGVEAIGLNFWSGTPRKVDVAFAAQAVSKFEEVEFVGVFVDAPNEEIERVRAQTGLRWVQLHGRETPAQLTALLPHAYKACGVADLADIEASRAFGGKRVLFDGRGGSMPGGSGTSFDWDLAAGLSAERELTLAGGLHAGNVQEAIARVRPARVDVASGVESAPGQKDPDLIRAFIDATR